MINPVIKLRGKDQDFKVDATTKATREEHRRGRELLS